MSNVTKKELIDRIVSQTGFKRPVVRLIVTTFLETTLRTLGDGSRIELRDFGVFEVKPRKARLAQNPKTLTKVSVPAKSAVKFKPGRKMKEVVAAVSVDGDHGSSRDGRGRPPRLGSGDQGDADEERGAPVITAPPPRAVARR